MSGLAIDEISMNAIQLNFDLDGGSDVVEGCF
jgi:hypothetical protein